MKLTNIALIAATAHANDGSGDDDFMTESSVTEQTDGAIQLEHRSIFGNSPFAAIFASLGDKPKKEKKPKNDSILGEVASDVDDYEDLDEYEGELEGFDIEQFRESDAVNRVLNQAMFQQANFQRGQSGGFGGINGGPNSPGVAQSTANRVEVLMKMIMYLQVDPSFDKFFQYGCYCFPDGEKSVLGGYGEARDGADQICKKYHNCQRCINKDYNDCPEWAPYKYKGRQDPTTGQKYLECLNKEGSCRRNHCECDKRLAEQLAEYEMAWNPQYSLAFGGFDRAKSCPAADKRTNNNNDNQHECCGNYPDRYPYVSESETGVLRKCCDTKTYDPRVLACCQDNVLKQHGTCGV